MAELMFRLPGFAADFSGAASVLSSMQAMVAMYGPTQCLKNYESFDAPNWFSSPGLVFSTYMDENDAIMGNYREITERIANSARKHSPDFIAVIGSPVSSMTGADHRGIAMEAERISGIPAIGVDTSGSHDYTYGIEKTYAALADRFLLNGRVPEADRVNILGYTYLDYCNGTDLDALCSYYTAKGMALGFVSGRSGLNKFERLQNASLNVVVSASALKFARYLKEVYGMDYTCELPVGGSIPKKTATLRQERCLFIGDQVMASNIRTLFESRYGVSGDVCTFFAFDRDLSREGDAKLDGEADLRERIDKGNYSIIVGDPLFMSFARCQFVPLPQPAVSSKLFWREHTRLYADDIVQHADRFLSGFL
jgi:nitrogenase molybdenum-cofactor synthesis protein NifE